MLRGGYGIFYEMENTDGRVNRNSLPFLLSETVFNTANTIPNRTLGNFFLGQSLGSAGVNPGMNPTYTHLRRGSRSALELRHPAATGRDTVLEVNYVGNHGTHLNSSNPFNDPPPGSGAIQGRRPYPAFGPINYFSQDMSSDYNALQVKAEKRYGAGIWFCFPIRGRRASPFRTRRPQAAISISSALYLRSISLKILHSIWDTNCHSVRASGF